MNQCENCELVTSVEGISYFITCKNTESPRPFGILATVQDDAEDTGCADNLFFTREEAHKCCMWLAENQVYPITLSEVLDNFYRL